MQLFCPTCRSELQVPDGTTAHVRCPACRAVFPAADGRTPPIPAPAKPAPAPAPRPQPNYDEDDRPRRPARTRHDEDEDDRPRPRRRRMHDDEDDHREEERDEDEAPRRRQRRSQGKLSPEERAVLRAQYDRGMWGARLVQYGFTLQAMALLIFTVLLGTVAMGLIVLIILGLCGCWGILILLLWSIRAYITGSIRELFATPAMQIFLIGIVALVGVAVALGPKDAIVLGQRLIRLAGGLGLLSYVVGAVGVGLCLASRPHPGLYRFGIAAAVAVVVHAVFLVGVVARGDALTNFRGANEPVRGNVLTQMATNMDVLSFYLVGVVYQDEQRDFRPLTLYFLTGLAEMVRLVLTMMTLSVMARSAGDDELSYRCIRAAGVGSFGPAALAVLGLLLFGAIIELGWQDRVIALVAIVVFRFGVYALLAALTGPAIVAARDTAEACEFPFESQDFEFGDK